MKVAQCMQKSAKVMKQMNALVRIPEIAETMQTLSREMARAGMIEEMTSEVLDDLDSDMEDEADAEVDKVLAGIVGDMPLPANDKLGEEEAQIKDRIMALKKQRVEAV
eukprot:TRINITY_DN8111_c0_g1_i2.p1 TRINITY_DN8111_c0_g1~~TRINITY_DN8111_c0_g1_i2.p1  ORF type:complete len:108 (+),score=31.91 TRINITY_DN8111_c0_g1_i2:283-606(+)